MQDADLQRLKRAVREGGQKEATRVAISILEQRNRKPSSRTADRLTHDRHTERLYEDLVDKVQVLEESINASRLLSPSEGVVVEVNAFVGDTWNPRSQVSTYRLMDDRRLVVWVLAPEEVVQRLQRSDPVLVRLPNAQGMPGAVVRGKVDEISAVQIEGVSDQGVLELLRQIRIALPSDMSSGLEVGDDALIAFPP
jgi:multidrug efflux pump subunit AcrA (membrane-fusion protein)